MAKYISLNDEWIIDISEIQSVNFKAKEIKTLYSHQDLAKRFTQLLGKEVPHGGIEINSNYDIVRIELKSGQIIIIEDFSLKEIKEYIFSQLQISQTFDCGIVKYIQPDNSSINLDGEVKVDATLRTGDYPVDLSWRNGDEIEVKIKD